MLLLKFFPPQIEMFCETAEAGTGVSVRAHGRAGRLHSQQPCADARRF